MMRSARAKAADLRERARTRRLVAQTQRALMPPPLSAFRSCPPTVAMVHPMRVSNPDCIEIGPRTLIHEHAWFEVQRRPGRPDPLLRLGTYVMLNRFVKIVCVQSVELGDHVVLGDRCYVSDVEYAVGESEVDPSKRTLTEAKPVVIEEWAFLGIGVVVKPGVRIGAHSYIGAGSVVYDDVPPYSLAVGNPAKVLRRYNSESDTWEPA